MVDVWVFGRNEEPSDYRVDGLVLVAQPSTDDLLKERQARHRRMKANRIESTRARIERFLRTMPAGTTVEEVAEQNATNCKLVREIVQELKANGELIEAAFRSHVLIRVRIEREKPCNT